MKQISPLEFLRQTFDQDRNIGVIGGRIEASSEQKFLGMDARTAIDQMKQQISGFNQIGLETDADQAATDLVAAVDLVSIAAILSVKFPRDTDRRGFTVTLDWNDGAAQQIVLIVDPDEDAGEIKICVPLFVVENSNVTFRRNVAGAGNGPQITVAQGTTADGTAVQCRNVVYSDLI